MFLTIDAFLKFFFKTTCLNFFLCQFGLMFFSLSCVNFFAAVKIFFSISTIRDFLNLGKFGPFISLDIFQSRIKLSINLVDT